MTTANTYELAPRPGQTASQRKAELDAARFVAVRNLAHLIYKKPDGSSLMTYQETLDDREKVKMAIINHEIALNLLGNDLGAPVAIPAPVAPAQAAAVAAVTPTMQVPMQTMSPAPQMVPMAPAPVAPVAAPQAVAAVAPAEQAAPAVTGRARRGRPPAGGAGVAVAPPPAAAPMVPLAAATGQRMAPPAPMAPQAAPAAPTFAPSAPMAAPSYQAPSVQQAAPQSVQVDLSKVIDKIDQLGKGLTTLARDNEELKRQNSLLLVAVHHLHSTHKDLGGAIAGMNIVAFSDHLTKFLGNPQ